MIELSNETFNKIIDKISLIIKLKDIEIKNCALLAMVEELEELKSIKERDDSR